MKKVILTLSLFVSVNAFAGAYSFECSNADGSVKIGYGSLTIAGVEYEYYNEYSVTRLMGLELVDYLKETRPKVVVSAPDVPTNIAQGGVKNLSKKHFKDECGNPGTTTKYSEAVGIYNNDGTTLLDLARINCTDTIITGHCF